MMHKIRSFFAPKRATRVRDIAEEDLRNDFANLHRVDPETSRQWIRLQAELSVQPIAKGLTNRRVLPRFAFASVGVVVIFGSLYLYFTIQTPSALTFVTSKGEQAHFILMDSSEVTLNFATTLIVSDLETGNPRVLSLDGEAFFHVRQNETSFTVSTPFGSVRVIGTEFNLRARNGLMEVAVIHGRVEISVTRNSKDSTLLLSENQIAHCRYDGFPRMIGEMPSPDYPGWLQGKLFLKGTSLAEVCNEIEMRFDISVTIRDKRNGEELITGILEAKTAESALASLCALIGRKLEHDNTGYIIF